MREELAPIRDHAIAADLRAASAQLRHANARDVREAPTINIARIEADFARMFGAR
jgi:hypothetical protein